MSNQQKFDDQEKKYIYHKVLWAKLCLPLQNNTDSPWEQLRRENRDLRFPQVGDFVSRGAKRAEVQEIEQIKAGYSGTCNS